MPDLTQATRPAKQMLKWSIPVDDQDHTVEMPTPWAWHIQFADCQYGPESVQFWIEHVVDAKDSYRRIFRVFGTGQEVPPEYHYRKTVTWKGEVLVLVWHLFEKEL